MLARTPSIREGRIICLEQDQNAQHIARMLAAPESTARITYFIGRSLASAL
jgi:hypothetical protein